MVIHTITVIRTMIVMIMMIIIIIIIIQNREHMYIV